MRAVFMHAEKGVRYSKHAERAAGRHVQRHWHKQQVPSCGRVEHQAGTGVVALTGQGLTMMPPHIASACCSPMTAATETDSFSSTGKNWGPGAASLRHHGQYGCMTSSVVIASMSPTASKRDSAHQYSTHRRHQICRLEARGHLDF